MPTYRYNQFRKILLVIVMICMLAGCFLMPQLVTAEDGDITPATAAEMSLNIGWMEKLIYYSATSIGGLVVGIGGITLNYGIDEFVIKMGQYFTTNIGSRIDILWTVIRDLFNILFICGLIYIGFKTILNSEDTQTRRWLVSLIAAAILINFSLFIAKSIIEVSNLAAVAIHNSISCTSNCDGGSIISGNVAGISGAFMDQIRLQTFFQDKTILERWSTNSGWYPSPLIIGYSFFILITMIIAGIVFFAGGIMLIARFIALIILLIFSPLMFIGWVFPQLENVQKSWRSHFLKYSFFAPAYLFMLYLALAVSSNYMTNAQKGFAVAYEGGSTIVGSLEDPFAIVAKYLLVIGMLIGAVYVAMKMSVAGASTTMNVLKTGGNKLQGFAKGAAWAGVGLVGRNTIGRTAERMKSDLDESISRNGLTARALRYTGLERSTRNLLERGEKAKFGGSYSRSDDVSYTTEREKRSARINSLSDINDSIARGSVAGAGDAEIIKMEQAVAGASSGQLIEMAKSQSGLANLKEVAGQLSQSQFDSIIKSDDPEITDTLRADLSRARTAQTQARLLAAKKASNPAGSPDPTIKDVIGKANASELATLGYQAMLDNAASLTSKQIEEVSGLTPTQLTRLKDKRNKELEETFKSDPESVFDYFNDTEISKLTNIVKDPNAAKFLNTKILDKIIDNDAISGKERRDIKSAVLEFHNNHSNPTIQKEYSDYFETPRGRQYT